VSALHPAAREPPQNCGQDIHFQSSFLSEDRLARACMPDLRQTGRRLPMKFPACNVSDSAWRGAMMAPRRRRAEK
jgi:hypothetical protein